LRIDEDCSEGGKEELGAGIEEGRVVVVVEEEEVLCDIEY
jgi:hypothetical protein